MSVPPDRYNNYILLPPLNRITCAGKYFSLDFVVGSFHFILAASNERNEQIIRSIIFVCQCLISIGMRRLYTLTIFVSPPPQDLRMRFSQWISFERIQCDTLNLWVPFFFGGLRVYAMWVICTGIGREWERSETERERECLHHMCGNSDAPINYQKYYNNNWNYIILDKFWLFPREREREIERSQARNEFGMEHGQIQCIWQRDRKGRGGVSRWEWDSGTKYEQIHSQFITNRMRCRCKWPNLSNTTFQNIHTAEKRSTPPHTHTHKYIE